MSFCISAFKSELLLTALMQSAAADCLQDTLEHSRSLSHNPLQKSPILSSNLQAMVTHYHDNPFRLCTLHRMSFQQLHKSNPSTEDSFKLDVRHAEDTTKRSKVKICKGWGVKRCTGAGTHSPSGLVEVHGVQGVMHTAKNQTGFRARVLP